MVNLTISAFMSNGSLNLYVDNVLVLANKDSVTVPLEEGNEYVVHWFVDRPGGQLVFYHDVVTTGIVSADQNGRTHGKGSWTL